MCTLSQNQTVYLSQDIIVSNVVMFYGLGHRLQTFEIVKKTDNYAMNTHGKSDFVREGAGKDIKIRIPFRFSAHKIRITVYELSLSDFEHIRPKKLSKSFK